MLCLFNQLIDSNLIQKAPWHQKVKTKETKSLNDWFHTPLLPIQSNEKANQHFKQIAESPANPNTSFINPSFFGDVHEIFQSEMGLSSWAPPQGGL